MQTYPVEAKHSITGKPLVDRNKKPITTIYRTAKSLAPVPVKNRTQENARRRRQMTGERRATPAPDTNVAASARS